MRCFDTGGFPKSSSHVNGNSHWRGDDAHVETNLLAVLRIAARIRTNSLNINIQNLGKRYREPLCSLGCNWHLSLRLLNLLLREGFVNRDSIKDDSGRIADIVNRMSPMNMYRFLKSGLLQRSDLPAARIRELGNELKPELAQELVNIKYLRAEDIAGTRLSSSELEFEDGRNRIKKELANKRVGYQNLKNIESGRIRIRRASKIE